jgi:hypothetical protein
MSAMLVVLSRLPYQERLLLITMKVLVVLVLLMMIKIYQCRDPLTVSCFVGIETFI